MGKVVTYQNHRKSLIRRIIDRWHLYLMMLPALAYIILFRFKPLYGIQIAFKDYNIRSGIWESEWIGFDNFLRLFSSHTFPLALKNTFIINIVELLINFPFPIILALCINEVTNKRVKKTLQTVYYGPHFISTVVICGMVIMFLSPSYGVINKFIELFGGESIPFMQEPGLFKYIFSLSGVWQNAGWGTVIYMSALSAVDQSLLEAAEMDGASRFQRLRYINLPVIVPTISILLILECGKLLSLGYQKVLLLQNSANLSGSEVLSTYIYKLGRRNPER